MKKVILAVAFVAVSACGNSTPAAGPAGASPEAGTEAIAPAKPADAGALSPDKK